VGTSHSSTGPPSNVPLVPPWVPDPVPPNGPEDNEDDRDQPTLAPQPASAPSPLAPPGRFGPARTSLGRFASSGSGDDMRRGLGHYVGKGLGGSGAASRRLGGTSRTAGNLYGALSAAAAGRPAAPGSPLNPNILAGRSARDIMDAVVEAVRPSDGTQDAEASRTAIRDGLSELLEQFPEADLLNLTEEQRLFAVERYLARDVFYRVRLDVGKAVQDKAPGPSAALSRLRQIRDYIREKIAARFRALRNAVTTLSARAIAGIAAQALRETFQVFEDFV
jgi:hypothetical protein